MLWIVLGALLLLRGLAPVAAELVLASSLGDAIGRVVEIDAVDLGIAFGEVEVEGVRVGGPLVDDEPIYSVQKAKVGLFRDLAYRDYPNVSQHARGGRLER